MLLPLLRLRGYTFLLVGTVEPHCLMNMDPLKCDHLQYCSHALYIRGHDQNSVSLHICKVRVPLKCEKTLYFVNWTRDVTDVPTATDQSGLYKTQLAPINS